MAGVNGFDEAIETMEECIQDVAKEIGRDWKKLGRKLKVKECVIEGIEEEYKPTEERAYQVLKKWLQVNGTHGATIHVLYEALIAIDKTYIAEKLIAPKHSDPSPEEPLLIRKISPTRSIPPSCNHYNNSLETFDRKLNDMFENCIENLTEETDNLTLVGKMKSAQDLIELNKILTHMVNTDSNGCINGDGAELAKIEDSCKKRDKQTDQIVRLILQTLAERGQPPLRKTKATKARPLSEIPKRSTSVVKLQPRSGTFSCGISSPLSVSTNSLLSRADSRGPSPLRDQICEEDPQDIETSEDNVPCARDEDQDVDGCYPRCNSCGSCLYFEARIDDSENQEKLLDENRNEVSESCPVADKIAIERLLHDLQDTRL